MLKCILCMDWLQISTEPFNYKCSMNHRQLNKHSGLNIMPTMCLKAEAPSVYMLFWLACSHCSEPVSLNAFACTMQITNANLWAMFYIHGYQAHNLRCHGLNMSNTCMRMWWETKCIISSTAKCY